MKKCKKHGDLNLDQIFYEYSNLRKKQYMRCKLCKKEKHAKWQKKYPEKTRVNNRRSYLKNREYVNTKNAAKVKNTTFERIEELKKKQKNLCAICNKSEKMSNRKDRTPNTLHIDHCHNTGIIRGLLCHMCNSGIGFFKDDIINMKNAIKYLRKHQEYLNGSK